MTHVLTALGNRWDSRVATLLEGSREVTIVRRCADLPDLVATAAAGLGTVALVSSDLRGLDLTVVAQLRSAGVHVVGITPDGDEDSERRLRQLGVGRIVPGSVELADLEAALTETAPAVDETLLTLESDLAVTSPMTWPAASERRVGPDPPLRPHLRHTSIAAVRRVLATRSTRSVSTPPRAAWWPSGARPARPDGPPSR